ncbi:MAG: tetratricopeptide repeat protein [Candidatus Sumerlaeia bacterium]|nr:tetratricopeptide repeat protein [Candidatus Sumerlaeia bacterium]
MWTALSQRISPLSILVAFFAITFPLWSNAYLSPPDSASYLAVSRTIVHGGNIDFRPDYEVLEFEWYFYYLTDTGRISNDWPIGSGLLWLPAYAAARGVAVTAAAVGVEGRVYPPEAESRHLLLPRPIGTGMYEPTFAPSGKSGVYKLFVTTWVAGMAIIALMLGISVATPLVGRNRALAAAFIVLLGTPVGFYTYAFAIMSHIPSMLATGILLWGWHVTRGSRSLMQWAGLGVAAGVMVMVRPQDGVFLSIFLVEAIMDRHRVLGQWRQWLLGTAVAGGAAIAAFLPQAITWWVLYGNPLQLPKIEEMHWFRPRLMDTLFSEYHGILSWSPVLLLIPVGIWRLWKRDNILAAAVATVIVIQVYLNAANEIWWAGGSFGNRRMVACGVPFVIAIAGALAWGRLRFILPVAILLSLWNFLLWAAERGGLIYLGHFIPWDGDFYRTVFGMLLPWKAFHAMLGDFAGFGWPTRLLFMAGGIALAVRLAFYTPKCSLRPVLMTVVVYFAALSLLFPILALRTPVHAVEDFDIPPPRENLSLFNGYYEYGFFNLMKGRIDNAEEAYTRANELIPSHPNPYRYLATIRLQYHNDPEGALELLRTALDINPHYHGALQIMEAAISVMLPHRINQGPLLRELADRHRKAGNEDRAREIEGMIR